MGSRMRTRFRRFLANGPFVPIACPKRQRRARFDLLAQFGSQTLTLRDHIQCCKQLCPQLFKRFKTDGNSYEFITDTYRGAG